MYDAICLHRTLSEWTRMNDGNGQNVVISCVSYETYVHSQTIFHNKCHWCCWLHTYTKIRQWPLAQHHLVDDQNPHRLMMFACYKSQIYIYFCVCAWWVRTIYRAYANAIVYGYAHNNSAREIFSPIHTPLPFTPDRFIRILYKHYHWWINYYIRSY